MYRLIVLLFIAFFIRLLFVGNPGFIADVSFWKSWSLAAIDHGIVWTAHNTNINYPPGFIYILWLMGKAYSLIGNPHNFNSFWQINNFPFLLVSKMPAIISDLIIGYLIYWFSKISLNPKANKAQYFPLLLSSLFLFNPVTILDSAVWGQVESFGLLFSLIAVLLIFKKRPLLASFIFTFGFMMKLQNIIYIPIFFLFIWRYFNFETLVKSIAASLFAFVIIIFPFLMAHDMDRVLLLMTVNSDYFPWLSLHAHNPWWIVAQGKMMASDKILILGILNAKTIGLILFSSIYLLLTIYIYKRPNPKSLITALAVSIFAFFLLTTQSHERYSYPVLVWLLLLIPFLESKFWTKYTLILFSVFSLAIFFNMHEGLVANYPENGIGILTAITNPTTTNLNVILQVSLFFSILPFIAIDLSPLYFSIPVLLIILSAFFLNFSYLLKGKVHLTSLKPLSIRQDYGTLQFNRSVNSFQGPKNWNVLSSNYFFYDKGIGTHANSNLVFDIGKKFTRFSTDFGVDSEADIPASIIFKIYADNKELFSSAKMGRFDFPRHTDVNVSGVKYLTLEVNDAGDGISSDHADWLNPILYR